MSYIQHQDDSGGIVARCGVITLSDTRTEATDKSGGRIKNLLLAASHVVSYYTVIRDEPAEFSAVLQALLMRNDIDVVLTSGGTGISRRDRTIEVAEAAIEQPIAGFGELFRMLSWQEIGSGAMLSRAIGGIARDKAIFCMPGSTAAVELAMTKLILPEIRHVIGEMRRDS